MKHNTRAGRSGYARLAALNPVPSADREGLVARLGEIRPQLPKLDRSAQPRRWKPPVIALTVIVLLALGGVAVAGAWDPLAAIGSADRPAEPSDTLSPAVIERLRRSEFSPPGWVSPIGTQPVDQARLLGELPNGHEVYAVPTSKGKLCILVADGAERGRLSGWSCGDPLSRDRPITMTVSKVGPGSPHVIWGATADDVVSVSFEVGGQPVTVPVLNNFYAWEGHPTDRLSGVSPATATFSDGSTAQAR